MLFATFSAETAIGVGESISYQLNECFMIRLVHACDLDVVQRLFGKMYIMSSLRRHDDMWSRNMKAE